MNKLKELREDCDYTQKEIAYYLHITRSKYSNIENGITDLTIDIAIDLVIFYNVDLYYIFGYSNNKNISKEKLKEVIKRRDKLFIKKCGKRKTSRVFAPGSFKLA